MCIRDRYQRRVHGIKKANSPGKMGRKKIKINYIEDDKFRRVTYCKRKRGLLKKAMELSLLCGNEVLLIIRDKATKRAVLYNSEGTDDRGLFEETMMNKELTSMCTNTDYLNVFDCGENNSVKPKGLKALKEVSTKKNSKRSGPESTNFQKKLKQKGAGLKINIEPTSTAPTTSLFKGDVEMSVVEEEKVQPQPEVSSTQLMFGLPQSALYFGLDAFHSAGFSAFRQPSYSPLNSFNIMTLRANTEDDPRKAIKLI
eukprot:TRINITY_DN68_c0_g1_i7.p1 TRINITY_DN68_c0_g1~~TRINITY_DN68_c0_g1_i7.p1  ORF type:complete len:256 (+),score=41.24 TRINITY_DN68_c0_g1_i7:97-864(+)